eukprot:TRINITY_DN9004_c0_g1_i6.p3 TRINITY_DN9004_c0_g1~~TRINITY_DN9004_c0_g1_i6.p3  ORF type:complete len:220 (-),score=-10.34 TRINITY_DN9004_c0_g1_i6:2069-2728(-)
MNFHQVIRYFQRPAVKFKTDFFKICIQQNFVAFSNQRQLQFKRMQKIPLNPQKNQKKQRSFLLNQLSKPKIKQQITKIIIQIHLNNYNIILFKFSTSNNIHKKKQMAKNHWRIVQCNIINLHITVEALDIFSCVEIISPLDIFSRVEQFHRVDLNRCVKAFRTKFQQHTYNVTKLQKVTQCLYNTIITIKFTPHFTLKKSQKNYVYYNQYEIFKLVFNN